MSRSPAPSLRLAVLPVLLSLLATLPGCGDGAPPSSRASTDASPSLLVLVVVDQLGSDLLDRALPSLDGGFARLARQGRSFPGTEVAHAVTNSGPGHATLATGTHPSGHGIVDNGFFRRAADGTWRYGPAPLDTAARIVGGGEGPGYSSAHRLASALGDWARAADSTARSVAIGQGAHSTNAMASSEGGEAWWFSAEAGGYVTSTHYRSDVPAWVARFHGQVLPDLVADTVWEVGVPAELRDHAVPDDVPWEARDGNGVFPHTPGRDLSTEARAEPEWRWAWFQTTPGIDRATLGLAGEAVTGLRLGTRGPVDVLSLNLSSLDEAGHRFGPNSLEQLDALVRLDRALGDFLELLDREVGPDQWALALSADHGAALPPEQRTAGGDAARRIPVSAMDSAWAQVARATEGLADPADRFQAAREVLEDRPWVARVYAAEDLAGGPTGGDDDPFLALYRRSFHPERRLDFPLYDRSGRTDPVHLGIGAVRMAPDAMMDFATSIHGSPYEFDRQVPLLLVGPGVSVGTGNAARTVDVAPTLAGLAGLPVPNGVDGRDLLAGG